MNGTLPCTCEMLHGTAWYGLLVLLGGWQSLLWHDHWLSRVDSTHAITQLCCHMHAHRCAVTFNPDFNFIHYNYGATLLNHSAYLLENLGIAQAPGSTEVWKIVKSQHLFLFCRRNQGKQVGSNRSP